jgi:hypothetical protein
VSTSSPVPAPPVSDPPARRSSLAWLPRSRLIASVALLAGILALLYGVWRTRDSVADLRQAIAARHAGKNSALIDLSPLQTAQRLASQATLHEETAFAADALRLADHEVDQAFATALRDAATSAAPSKQQQQVQARVTQLFARTKDDQKTIDALNGELPHAKNADDVQQDVELAQAQLALDQDDLEDAQQVLARSGPDRHQELEQALKQQQESEQKPQLPSPVIPGLHTLHDRYEFWQTLRARRGDVQAAAQESAANANRLLTERNRREADLQQREIAAKSFASTRIVAAAPPAPNGAAASAAQSPVAASQAANSQAPAPLTRSQAILQLKSLAEERTALTEYDRRIADLHDLSAVYVKWQTLLDSRQRLEVHFMLLSLAWVLLILALAVLADAALRHYFATLPADRSRIRNLRVFMIATVQTIAFLLILVVLFGKPAQLYTALGLIGAGLAVALKDFILGFLGYFFLMGKHGLRIGDWVEIEGVAGEVVELGLLRTVLFETGNWTDSGHPTGRRVAFFNNFAINGHFFNFSTQGQWLWDELRIPLGPAFAAGQDAYTQLLEIDRVVKQVGSTAVQQAEQEWRAVTARYGVKHFSADPTVEMRPTATGFEVVVRYITRAQDRTSDRAALYQKILDALRQPAAAPAE